MTSKRKIPSSGAGRALEEEFASGTAKSAVEMSVVPVF
jgi:hypothetical protein